MGRQYAVDTGKGATAMTELDRQIRATLQTLVALQGAKIIQLEREVTALKGQLEAARKREAMIRPVKQEVQA